MEIQGIHINAHSVNSVFILTKAQIEGIINMAKIKGVEEAAKESVLLDARELGEMWDVKPTTVKKYRREGHPKLGTLPFELTYKAQMNLKNAQETKQRIFEIKTIKR